VSQPMVYVFRFKGLIQSYVTIIEHSTVAFSERSQWLRSAGEVAQWALADSSLRLVSTPRSSKDSKVRANHIKESVNAHW